MKCCPSPRLLHLDAGSRCQECGLFIPRSANDRRERVARREVDALEKAWTA